MWLLGNLFRTEKRLWRLSGAPRKIFEITTDVMVSSTENYGILLAAANLPKSLASPIKTVAVRLDANVSTRANAAISTAQVANVRCLLFPMKPPPLNLTSNLNQRFFLRGTVAALPSSHRSRR